MRWIRWSVIAIMAGRRLRPTFVEEFRTPPLPWSWPATTKLLIVPLKGLSRCLRATGLLNDAPREALCRVNVKSATANYNHPVQLLMFCPLLILSGGRSPHCQSRMCCIQSVDMYMRQLLYVTLLHAYWNTKITRNNLKTACHYYCPQTLLSASFEITHRPLHLLLVVLCNARLPLAYKTKDIIT